MSDKFTDFKMFILGVSVIIFLSLFGSCYEHVYGHDIDLGVVGSSTQQTIPLQRPFLSCADESKPKFVIRNQTKFSEEEIYYSVLSSVSGVNLSFFIDSKDLYSYQQPNFETDEDCNLIIRPNDYYIEHNSNVKVIKLVDNRDYCGLSTVSIDDKKVNDNKNNFYSVILINYNRCNITFVWLHEIMHSLGAVQKSSPNNTGDFHSTIFGDIMGLGYFTDMNGCDGWVIDCYKNSYYNNGFIQENNYLKNQWNTADNVYLKTLPRYVVFLPTVFHERNANG